MYRSEDLTVAVAMQPPTDISTWSFQFQVLARLGGSSGLITKSFASGYMGGQSGITVVNSGQGVFNIGINSPETSGWDSKNYAYQGRRMNSGSQNVISEGYLIVLPGIGQ